MDRVRVLAELDRQGLSSLFVGGRLPNYDFPSLPPFQILRAGGGRPLRGTALRSLLDDRPEARRIHPGE